jgi:hypothetical protein
VTLDPLPPVGSELTAPLARLLFALAEAGLLGPKPGPLSAPVPPVYRCQGCHSPTTRMKMVRLLPAGSQPAVGFELRARCCGAINQFRVPNEAERVAA